ncbi:MAG: hypothetical protein WD716_13285 [Fimbriimonadaceae bacterium]
MTHEVSISKKLKTKLKEKEEARLDEFAEALLDLAIEKNTTAMKLVVDLVEPPKQPAQEEPRQLTDEELLDRLHHFVERVAARRDQPKARS